MSNNLHEKVLLLASEEESAEINSCHLNDRGGGGHEAKRAGRGKNCDQQMAGVDKAQPSISEGLETRNF